MGIYEFTENGELHHWVFAYSEAQAWGKIHAAIKEFTGKEAGDLSCHILHRATPVKLNCAQFVIEHTAEKWAAIYNCSPEPLYLGASEW